MFGVVCGKAVWKPLIGGKIKHMLHVHTCIGMCVCAHENEFERGGGPLVAKRTPYGRPVRV